MRKHFFILLLAVSSTFCSHAQVVISNKAAQYFLEVDDKYKVMLVKDTLQTVLISDLRFQVKNRELSIGTYKSDSSTNKEIKDNLTARITLKKEQNHNLKVMIRHWKMITIGSVALEVVIILIAVL